MGSAATESTDPSYGAILETSSSDPYSVAADMDLFTTLASTLVSELGNGTDPKTPQKPTLVCKAYCDLKPWQVQRYMYVIQLILLPSIVIFGIFGNISSILVLSRQSMAKSSNILLIVLACGDLLYLLGCCQIFNTWRLFFKTRLTVGQAMAMYYTHMSQNVVLVIGNVISVVLALFITIERLVAVYFPLKFTMIIRPRRTLVAASVVVLLGVLKAVVGCLSFGPSYNARKGTLKLQFTPFYKANLEFYEYFGEAYDIFVGFVSVTAVCVGSILIGVRVSIASRLRAKMMSTSGGDARGQQPQRASRTTVTLLAVCIMFTCTMGLALCVEIGLTPQRTWTYYILRYQFTYLLYTVNSSFNFIIYVALNKNFRDTYLSILMPWRKTPIASKSRLARTSTYRPPAKT